MQSPRKTSRKRKAFLQVSLAAYLLVAACFACLAQASQPNLQQFAGTWQARFNGKIFQTITLEMHDGQLTGTASGVHIELNGSGELTEAEAIGPSDPIADAKIT